MEWIFLYVGDLVEHGLRLGKESTMDNLNLSVINSVYDLLMPKYVEIVVNGTSPIEKILGSRGCLDMDSGKKKFFIVPIQPDYDKPFWKVVFAPEFIRDKNVYYSLMYMKPACLDMVSVFDRFGNAIKPYYREGEKKWVKKTMFISTVYNRRKYLAGWNLSIYGESSINNITFISTEPAQSYCSPKCFAKKS